MIIFKLAGGSRNQIFITQHNDLIFFILSAYKDWFKEYLKTKNQFVNINFNKNDVSFFNIYLIRFWKFIIISKSSLSFWFTKVNQNKDKIVISTKKWFANKSTNTKDLIHSSWIKI